MSSRKPCTLTVAGIEAINARITPSGGVPPAYDGPPPPPSVHGGGVGGGQVSGGGGGGSGGGGGGGGGGGSGSGGTCTGLPDPFVYCHVVLREIHLV